MNICFHEQYLNSQRSAPVCSVSWILSLFYCESEENRYDTYVDTLSVIRFIKDTHAATTIAIRFTPQHSAIQCDMMGPDNAKEWCCLIIY